MLIPIVWFKYYHTRQESQGITLAALACQQGDRYSVNHVLNALAPGGPNRLRFPPPPSLGFPVILVGRAGRGNAARDLRPAVMRPGQGRREGDAGAGDLRLRRVRQGERRGDGDRADARATPARTAPAAAATGNGGNHRRFTVGAAVNGDGLPRAKARRVGDRDDGRADRGGIAHRGGASRAHRRNDGGFEVRSRINENAFGVKSQVLLWRRA